MGLCVLCSAWALMDNRYFAVRACDDRSTGLSPFSKSLRPAIDSLT